MQSEEFNNYEHPQIWEIAVHIGNPVLSGSNLEDPEEGEEWLWE